MRGSIMDRITEAEAMVDIIARKAKVKIVGAARIQAIQKQMHTNAVFELAEAVETASGRPIQGGAARDCFDWIQSHPRQSIWLNDNADAGNVFAQSLLNGLRKFGSLTDKQQAALDKIVSEVKQS